MFGKFLNLYACIYFVKNFENTTIHFYKMFIIPKSVILCKAFRGRMEHFWITFIGVLHFKNVL